MLFKVIVLNGYLCKTHYYAIRVANFQIRGSPHIHSFIWILNVPKLFKLTKEEHAWVDIIRADLPDQNEKPELWNLFSKYQIHRH